MFVALAADKFCPLGFTVTAPPSSRKHRLKREDPRKKAPVPEKWNGSFVMLFLIYQLIQLGNVVRTGRDLMLRLLCVHIDRNRRLLDRLHRACARLRYRLRFG